MTLGDYITWGTAALGAFALLRLAYQRWQPMIASFFRQLYYAIDRYVELWQDQTNEQNAVRADTYQVKPRSEPPRTTGSEPVPNRENDIIYLAQRRSDSGEYTYSANKIVEFVGGMRTETLAAIRAARGQSEPTPDDAYSFESTGKHQSFVRTGVKPLR